MSRKKAAAAETQETPTAEPDFNPAEFDPEMRAIADRQATFQQQAAQVVSSVAAAHAMPPESGDTPPEHAAQHAPKVNGYAGAVKKKEFKPYADPFGQHLIHLSNDPKGPKARLLRSKEHNDMMLQFSENPGKEITTQLREAGLHWDRLADSDFARGAWILPLEPGNEWRNHAHAEEVFRHVVNQIREANGMEPFVPGAAQSAG